MSRKKKSTWETEQEYFPSTMRGLMKDKNITQKELADAIGMRPQTVSLYVTGQSAPDIHCLKKIAEFFDVSSDYLLGLAEDPTNKPDVKVACVTTGLSGDAVQTLMGFSQEEIDELNFLLTYESFRDFLKKLNEYRERWGRLLREEQREQKQADKYGKDGKHYVSVAPENNLYKNLLECTELNLHKCVSTITQAIDSTYQENRGDDYGKHHKDD